jgi:osmotically-inducible protein OsmY
MRNVQKLIAASAFVLLSGASSAAFAESTGQYVDDAAITTKVKTAIMADQKLKATQVSVQTNQGTVELSGTVADKTQESEAIRVANQVNGVVSVKDLLQVRSTQEQ